MVLKGFQHNLLTLTQEQHVMFLTWNVPELKHYPVISQFTYLLVVRLLYSPYKMMTQKVPNRGKAHFMEDELMILFKKF